MTYHVKIFCDYSMNTEYHVEGFVNEMSPQLREKLKLTWSVVPGDDTSSARMACVVEWED